ncbi:unnamed protein product [Plutella xylostella]|uniref:(diamondback moth) hypothetical protein n=1 Tax=Plutella xylostella TaxID=51655 RepID=A0A8S4G610_PLUXY|nr:unnamed protein product [Plutella xylostella]
MPPRTSRRRGRDAHAAPTHAQILTYTVYVRQKCTCEFCSHAQGGRMDLRLVLVACACAVATHAAHAAPAALDASGLTNIANVSYAADNASPGDIASIFSPRMVFDQWKPLTGRGDPLRNDPTYDYEPPVLERVHYWADEPRPDRKSEVLMLGVSSRKPSVAPRQPPRRHHRPPPPKYDEFSYKHTDHHYPMTILVPPPPPPPGHQPLLFTLDDKPTTPSYHFQSTERPSPSNPSDTHSDNSPHLNSLYALQEANLIYQSSTTNHNWLPNDNETKDQSASTVSSNYAGWGPTTPIDSDEGVNDTHNFIFSDHYEMSRHPFSFYRPMLSDEAPPPPHKSAISQQLPTFMPTALPETTTQPAHYSHTETEAPATTADIFETETTYYQEATTADKGITFQPTPLPTTAADLEPNPFGMMGSMLSMPLVNGPDRPEDNLYAHASENLHVYKEHHADDEVTLESMQTMQPPPPSHVKMTESPMLHKKPFHVNTNLFSRPYKKPTVTLDPYVHMRITSPAPTESSNVEFENILSATDAPVIPTYLIIQGHSKVKTYSSKPKNSLDKESVVNEIPKPNETNEVKHLHPIKDQNQKKSEKTEKSRVNSGRNLKSLIDEGVGSIEIQEANVGIKYDVSDGSDVPVEIYRKGIVESDENDYSARKNRPKRQLDLEDFLPFDEDQIEEYVFDFLKGKKNETGITGLIASAVTSDAAAAVDDIDEDDSDAEDSDEDR